MQPMMEREISTEWSDVANIIEMVRDLGRSVLCDRIEERFREDIDNRVAIRVMMDAGLYDLTIL